MSTLIVHILFLHGVHRKKFSLDIDDDNEELVDYIRS